MSEPVVFAFGPDTCFAGIAGEHVPKEFSRKALGLDKGCEDLGNILRHAFENELKVDPSQRKIMFVAPPLAGESCREKIGKTLFEEFKVQAAYMAMDAVLSAYTSGQLDAIVISANEKGTFLVPVKTGYAVPTAIQKGLDLADADAVAEKVAAAIDQLDEADRDTFYKTVIISGIKSDVEGLPEKLESALKKKNDSAKVYAPDCKRYSHWIGGSVLANLGDFQSMWINKDAYGKKGVAIMHEKCNFQAGKPAE